MVVEEIGDGGGQDETEVLRRGVRQDAGNVFPPFPFQEKSHGGGGTQGVSVRVGMTQDGHLGSGFQQGLEAMNLLLRKNKHRYCLNAMANLQKIIAFEKSFF